MKTRLKTCRCNRILAPMTDRATLSCAVLLAGVRTGRERLASSNQAIAAVRFFEGLLTAQLALVRTERLQEDGDRTITGSLRASVCILFSGAIRSPLVYCVFPLPNRQPALTRGSPSPFLRARKVAALCNSSLWLYAMACAACTRARTETAPDWLYSAGRPGAFRYVLCDCAAASPIVT